MHEQHTTDQAVGCVRDSTRCHPRVCMSMYVACQPEWLASLVDGVVVLLGWGLEGEVGLFHMYACRSTYDLLQGENDWGWVSAGWIRASWLEFVLYLST